MGIQLCLGREWLKFKPKSSSLLLDYESEHTKEEKEMAEIMKKLLVAAVIPDSVSKILKERHSALFR